MGQLRTIGDVAALNLVRALNLPKERVLEVEKAIRDEIHAMSSHFTLAVADATTHYEAEVLKLKQKFELDTSEFSYIAANPLKVGVAILVLLAVGFLVGHFA